MSDLRELTPEETVAMLENGEAEKIYFSLDLLCQEYNLCVFSVATIGYQNSLDIMFDENGKAKVNAETAVFLIQHAAQMPQVKHQ